MIAFLLALGATAFAYDPKQPLDLRGDGQSISFAVPGGRVNGDLIAPTGKPRAGVLFVHWLGPTNSDRTEFRADAEELARHGVVSLLVDAQWSAPRWFRTRTPDGDYAASIQQVVALRRALDVLEAQGVKEIAFVGHDFGGMYGTILGAVDGRPKWYVLVAVTTKLTDWFLLGKPPADKQAYLVQMAPLEPVQYLPLVKARAFLFQFAKNDEFVTTEHAAEYAAAAPGPKQVLAYETDHSLAIPAARADRIAWLLRNLP